MVNLGKEPHQLWSPFSLLTLVSLSLWLSCFHPGKVASLSASHTTQQQQQQQHKQDGPESAAMKGGFSKGDSQGEEVAGAKLRISATLPVDKGGSRHRKVH